MGVAHQPTRGIRVTQPTVGEQLATINTKLDVLIEQRTDHEARIRVLEQARWKLVGLASAVGAIAGVLAPFITNR